MPLSTRFGRGAADAVLGRAGEDAVVGEAGRAASAAARATADTEINLVSAELKGIGGDAERKELIEGSGVTNDEIKDLKLGDPPIENVEGLSNQWESLTADEQKKASRKIAENKKMNDRGFDSETKTKIRNMSEEEREFELFGHGSTPADAVVGDAARDKVFAESAGMTEEELKKVKNYLKDVVDSNPRLTKYAAGLAGLYGLAYLFQNSGESCQELCLSGENEEWVNLHSNYNEFCSDKSSSECATYCDPNHGETGENAEDDANAAGDDAACSASSRMKSFLKNVGEEAAEAVGSGAKSLADTIKKLLLGPVGIFLGGIIGCICFLIIGYTLFSMLATKATTAVTSHSVYKTIQGSDITQGIKDNTKKLAEHAGGSGKSILNKYFHRCIMLIIFFIFIIYNGR